MGKLSEAFQTKLELFLRSCRKDNAKEARTFVAHGIARGKQKAKLLNQSKTRPFFLPSLSLKSPPPQRRSTLPLFRKLLMVLTVLAVLTGLTNLTDVEYRNHLSRVKEIMPEAGRGLSLSYRVVF